MDGRRVRIMRRARIGIAMMTACAAWFGGALDAHAAGKFDGAWHVTLNCATTPSPDHAVSYTYQFPATVVEGVLHGEHGAKKQRGWLALDGKIEPDGVATLVANGLTNSPEHALGHPSPRTPYSYQVSAHFDAASGSGQRTTARQCDFVFVKS